MPTMAYLALDEIDALTRADWVRLGLVTPAGDSALLPYSDQHLADFEQRYCFDRYFQPDCGERWMNTRLMCSGHSFVMVGRAAEERFTDLETGLQGQFRHQYFLVFLIAHFQKAGLLMLSDRLIVALSRLDIQKVETVKEFKRSIRQTLEIFLRFNHRYWFHEISNQVQLRDLYKMLSGHLGSDALYTEVRDEVKDMSDYLESDTLRRQANTVVRLTVVTVFGLIGTVLTGVFGMNLFDFPGIPWPAAGRAVRDDGSAGDLAAFLYPGEVQGACRLSRLRIGHRTADARQVQGLSQRLEGHWRVRGGSPVKHSIEQAVLIYFPGRS